MDTGLLQLSPICAFAPTHGSRYGQADCVYIRVFNRLEFSGRHDFQAKKLGRLTVNVLLNNISFFP